MAAGDLILTNVTFTADDLSKLLAMIINGLNQNAKDPSQYDLVTSLEGISSLPVFHVSGSTYNLVRVAVSLLKGLDGKEVEFQKNTEGTYIQWRYTDGTWNNLIAIADLKGASGEKPVFRTGSAGIEWKYESEADTAYRSLVSYDLLKLTYASLTDAQKAELKGETGKTPVIEEVIAVESSATPSGSIVQDGTDEADNPKYKLSFVLPKGDKGNPGDAGKGISNIAKTGTEGLVDTYTVTYTDGSTITFTVTNGAPGSLDSGDAKNLIVSFVEAATRANILTGESLATIFGKIKKMFTDLSALAFSGSYSDLSDKPSIPTRTSDLSNDKNFATTTNVTDALSTHNTSDVAHTDIRALINSLTNTLNTLLSGNASVAIDNFNEIIAFLANVTDSTTLEGIIAALNTSIAAKVDKVDGKGLSTNDFSNDYKAKLDFVTGTNSVTTLASLPVTKRLVIATLSAATSLSLAAAMEVGQEIYIRCIPSAPFTQPIPNSGSFVSMSGSSITTVANTPFEISILCYAEGYYSIVVKTQD